MKTLHNHQLLYDADCPLCIAYTGAMEKTAMIAQGTRQPFQQAEKLLLNQLDAERAKSEIALFNTQTRQTRYGIDAMLHILFRNYPAMNKLLHAPPVYPFLKCLYAFISYNRKIIAPAAESASGNACVPPLHRGWRSVYIAFVVVLSGIVLTSYYANLNEYLNLRQFAGREWITCMGQILWQGVALFALGVSGKKWDYIGNMMTVSLIGTLMLLPHVLLQSLITIHPLITLAWFGAVVAFMLWEHMRRVQLLGVHGLLTASWVSYRLAWAVWLIQW